MKAGQTREDRTGAARVLAVSLPLRFGLPMSNIARWPSRDNCGPCSSVKTVPLQCLMDGNSHAAGRKDALADWKVT